MAISWWVNNCVLSFHFQQKHFRNILFSNFYDAADKFITAAAISIHLSMLISKFSSKQESNSFVASWCHCLVILLSQSSAACSEQQVVMH